MAQSSAPISQGTTAERQFTDVQWRDLFGDEPGVIGDLDGSAYALNLSGGGDVVNVGSTTEVSLAKVAGFVHKIPQSSPEPITIPSASGSTRTDVIALRYDPAYTGLPGPVRLVRIVGSSSAIPSYDSSPPGVEELPLWAITRAVGQPLSLATVTRLYPRLAPTMDLSTAAALPTSSPLGTVVYQGNDTFRRVLSAPLTPVWQEDNALAGGWTRTTQRSGGTAEGIDQYNGTGLLIGGSWSSAPAGDYRFDLALMLHRPSGSVPGTIAVTIGGVQVSPVGQRWDVPASAAIIQSDFYIRENWAGGDLTFGVAHTVSSGTTVNINNLASKGTLTYLGKR